MIILLNPYAGGGTAETKWRCIRDALALREPVRVCTLRETVSLPDLVRRALGNGERDFVAAGGDGTVNALVNALVPHVDGTNNRDVRCGAIGLGSSNDFHKPFAGARMVGGIPCRVDMAHARPRDVGLVRYMDGERWHERYFLINASVGVTADANDFFNHPDPLLRLLKRTLPAAAIAYAAARHIFLYKSCHVTLSGRAGIGEHVMRLTNLGIVKSPHVSGALRYDCPPAYTTGNFRVYLCAGMGIGGRLGLLWRLRRGEFPKNHRCRTWETSEVSIHADQPFAVEVDGEIVRTGYAHFAVLPGRLKVCP